MHLCEMSGGPLCGARFPVPDDFGRVYTEGNPAIPIIVYPLDPEDDPSSRRKLHIYSRRVTIGAEFGIISPVFDYVGQAGPVEAHDGTA